MNKPKQPEQQMRKLEVRERFFHLTPLVTEASLIQIPMDETIIGIEVVPGSTNRFCIYTMKEVTE